MSDVSSIRKFLIRPWSRLRRPALCVCAVPTELMFDVVRTDGDTLMNIEEFRTFVHAVTNVKSIIEQWKGIASELSSAELASLPQNTTLMARKTVL